ncbi:MMS19 nucleotide excision repair protein [Orchesella cincta]|uniref:MMS19 nucleotide excision repair protein n=1 Tax=Orchesella cincta TaxID=48709 RepID=A0A1D2NCM8_ORCCI|nr:MMS19 nucleotide excision repair protein [Orchesella cincta]
MDATSTETPTPPGTAPNSNNYRDKGVSELLDIIYLDTTPAVDGDVCKAISCKIKSKELSLVSVVEELGPRLTSTHVQERSKAVEILANVFAQLPSDFLNEKELQFIVDFLCDRCKDQHIVIPKIIMCVLPIVKCKNLPAGAGVKLLEQLFKEANIQSHIHKIRHSFFKSLQILLNSRLKEIQNMSSDFVMNFLQSMDGEKDPRNLLLLFRIIPCIVSEFELGPFLEDFFEMLSCYFPIDFNPTVKVPGEEMVTRDHLANALHICLSQTNEFAPFLIPLVMEKLESSSVDAKIDSLELLRLCCERSYVPQDLHSFLGQIWHAMRKEIFLGGNDKVEKKCYDFLRAAFKMISEDTDILNTCLTMIFRECRSHLSEPELRLIMPTANILRCITESGETACISVVRFLFPVLYDQICIKPSKSEKKRLLDIWETIINTCREYTQIKFNELVSTWDEIRGLWFTLLASDDWEIVQIVVKIFSHVIIVDTDFQKEHRDMLQQHLLRLVQTSFSMPHDTRSAIIFLSRRLCYFYGEEFSDSTIPKLLSTLSHSTPATDSLCEYNCEGNELCAPRALSCTVLGECSHLHPITFQKVVAYLLAKLKMNPLELESMKCLGSIVENACTKEENDFKKKPDLDSLFTSMCVLDEIISAAFQVCMVLKERQKEDAESDGSMVLNDVTVTSEVVRNCLLQATDIIRTFLRACDERQQHQAISQYWDKKVKANGGVENYLGSIPGILVEALIGPIRPSVSIQLKEALIKWILENISVDCNTFGKQTAEIHIIPHVRLLGSLVNKAQNDEELGIHLNEIDSFLDKHLCSNSDSQAIPELDEVAEKKGDQDSSSISNGEKSNVINALIWIVKGLAMRGFGELDYWVDKIIRLLNDKVLGVDAVNHFHFLVADDPHSLNPESFCMFRFLYKQRLFQTSVDKLVSGYRIASSQPVQFNFIRALSSQLKHVPSEILFLEIDSVLPLLVASLKCNSSSQVLLSTLNALMEMMNSQDTKHKLTEYCHDLVPQLTLLAQNNPSMDVRRTSLSCLRRCTKAPTHIILPLRDGVIDNLVPCLDDPKRLVRKEAIKTRSLWILISAPGGL